jgi:ABC-2 type transport system ATP-binding protein
MKLAIEVEGLRKLFWVRERDEGVRGAIRGLLRPRRREVVAVASVTFALERGERVAFVGPNGAGKSTTIKMLTGILRPTEGTARVIDHVPWEARRALAYRIGSVFGQRTQLFYHLPARDSFELLMHVYDQKRLGVHEAYLRRRAALLDAFELGPLLDTPVRQLSLGERMRCEIAASLLHAPEVLFLDEPTIGLDASAKAVIREVVREQAERHGRTLLLTSHDTADMERVCERVIVIHHGRVLLDQPIAALRRSYIKKKRVVLQTAEAALELSLPGVRVLSNAPHRLELEVELAVTPIEAVIAAALRAGQIQDLTVEDPPMDDIVRAIYARANASAGAIPSIAFGWRRASRELPS